MKENKTVKMRKSSYLEGKEIRTERTQRERDREKRAQQEKEQQGKIQQETEYKKLNGARSTKYMKKAGGDIVSKQVSGTERPERIEKSGKQEKSGRPESAGRQEKSGRPEKPGMPENAERAKRTKKPQGTEKLCPVSSKCGGCQWINISYNDQLQAKASRFRRLMEPYCKPEALIPMDNPVHYRNKVHAAFGEDRKHNVISGIYEEKSHRIVPVDSCLIENQKADEIIVSIRGLLKSFKIRPYNEDTGYGLLRHALVRVGHATGQIMVVLVLSSPVMPSKNNFVKALRQIHPEIDTIVVNVNDRDTSMILGDKEQVIYGRGYIEDELRGMTFRISPKSFYQVNPVQTEKLYAKAIEYAGLTGKETVLDAYCGTGTIGLIASHGAKEVIGVELNKDAVRDAVSNAKRNGISNIRFYQNDAGRFLLEMAEQSAKLDVLFMDPPRSGSDEAFLEAVAKIGPKRIVYISCNPETLARDLQILTKKGYKAEKSVAVDMFPFTDSLEAIVALRKTDFRK